MRENRDRIWGNGRTRNKREAGRPPRRLRRGAAALRPRHARASAGCRRPPAMARRSRCGSAHRSRGFGEGLRHHRTRPPPWAPLLLLPPPTHAPPPFRLAAAGLACAPPWPLRLVARGSSREARQGGAARGGEGPPHPTPAPALRPLRAVGEGRRTPRPRRPAHRTACPTPGRPAAPARHGCGG
ncbi:hypothetical protein PVAP13_8KG301875 [Panicum virgatum]|uniref:Uncharacterized protein n=1 Tax=Panicum virgatum TaxID=38727 RepID=A0A8T0PRG4_PANVG|nr:hypothetical protein PVAP13_8KG301875 [Panicum virgatum]